ncbi:MAG TPA: hypothetical protein VMR95_02130 [Candidatus Binatia bacterium]|nr:hypothetical protein [Candidatus Binatia bacterium]
MTDHRKKLSREFRNVANLQRQLKTKPESYWIKRGEAMALRLFHDMSTHVPAYQDFLYKSKFDPSRVKTIEDFQQVPLINKDNYLRKYDRNMLCWDGKFSDKSWVISTTSGSTGVPFYFPRGDLQDEYYAITAELYLRENFKIQDRKTLYIDAFAMGAWIGGLFTYEALHRVASKGYPLSIITPGINKTEVINSVKNLGPDFDQIIIGCYPPIMRDIIDLGIEEGLDWGKYNLGIVFSAEGFSEDFRDYIIKNGKLSDVFSSTLNHYGSVDLGTMSHETPFTIFLRRQALKDNNLYKQIYGSVTKQPTVTQFLPELFYFESVDNNVICSSYGGIPLVRYELNDHGGVISLEETSAAYKSRDKTLSSEIKSSGIGKIWNLPIVYIYERNDFSITFSGAQIYPEEVKKALLHSEFHHSLTGKFTMLSGYDKDAHNYFEINVELRKGVVPTEALKEKVIERVVEHLIKENSEYGVLYDEYGTSLHPRIKFWEYEHELHFSTRGKQKWVKKT